MGPGTATVTEVAPERGVRPQSLRGRYCQACADRGERRSAELTSVMREEVTKLRKRALEEQVAIGVLP